MIFDIEIYRNAPKIFEIKIYRNAHLIFNKKIYRNVPLIFEVINLHKCHSVLSKSTIRISLN